LRWLLIFGLSLGLIGKSSKIADLMGFAVFGVVYFSWWK
jgi:hypothetical protein